MEKTASAEQPEPTVSVCNADRRAKLLCILSAHVDDLMGAARRSVAESLLRHLEAAFGPCKAEWGTFLHTGIQHIHSPGRIECHQNEYVDSLRPMSISHLRGSDESSAVDQTTHKSYMQLLGGGAWTVLTRADAAIYIQALQRRAHAPRVVDCRRLNLVVRFLQRHKVGIVYEYVPGPHRLLGYPDAVFKAQEGREQWSRHLAGALSSSSQANQHRTTASICLITS